MNLTSYCKIHNTYPEDDEPCWQCVNKNSRELSDEITNLYVRMDEIFQGAESLRVRLCEVLNLDYTEATDEDVIQKVQELQDIKNDLTFDPIKQIWTNTYDK